MPRHPVDDVIADLARRQRGVISAAQLRHAGASSSLITRRVRAGHLDRIGHGLYVAPQVADHPQRPLWEAVLSTLGSQPDLRAPRAVVSCEAAGWLIGTPAIPRLSTVSVTVAHPLHPRNCDRWVVHQSTDLDPSHVTRIDGLPVTTPVRTAVDLGRQCSAARLAGIDDLVRQALHPGVHPGIELVDGTSRSALLLLEGDGRRWHDRVRQTTKDAQRDLEAAAQGWLTVRLTWRQLTRHRDAAIASLRALHRTRLRQLGAA